MENLEVTINLPCLKLNIPEDRINFHTLERRVFDLSRKIGQELLEELLKYIETSKIPNLFWPLGFWNLFVITSSTIYVLSNIADLFRCRIYP